MHQFRAWLRPTVGILLTLSGGSAQAGGYLYVRQPGSGSVTITPRGGSPSTIQLGDNPSFNYPSFGWFFGTLSYTFTETIEYQWARDTADTPATDPPQDLTITVTGSATFDFATPGGPYMSQSDTGSASMTMVGGNTVTASATATPPPPYPYGTFTGTGTEAPQALSRNVTLTGETGTITLQCTGSMDAGPNGIIGGKFNFQRFPINQKVVRITLVKREGQMVDGVAVEAGKVAARGRWNHDPAKPSSTNQYFVQAQTVGAFQQDGRWEESGVIQTGSTWPLPLIPIAPGSDNHWQNWPMPGTVANGCTLDHPDEDYFVQAILYIVGHEGYVDLHLHGPHHP